MCIPKYHTWLSNSIFVWLYMCTIRQWIHGILQKSIYFFLVDKSTIIVKSSNIELIYDTKHDCFIIQTQEMTEWIDRCFIVIHDLILPDESYSRNASCALILASTFLLICYCMKIKLTMSKSLLVSLTFDWFIRQCNRQQNGQSTKENTSFSVNLKLPLTVYTVKLSSNMNNNVVLIFVYIFK